MVFFTENWRPRRSALFMPASNARAIEKSLTLAADALIFDLEDSVGEGDRDIARANLLALVKGRDFGGRERIIRIPAGNAAGHETGVDVAIACAPDAILLPKVEDSGAILALRRRCGGIAIWAMIENPRAVLNISEIAAAPGLACLVIGPNDLAKSTGVPMAPGRAAMIPWFMSVLAGARANRLAILDGVYNNFRDMDGFGAECAQGAMLGFDGKTLIHPSQIEAANRAFTPAPREFARARAVVAAFSRPGNASRGAIEIDGGMVERLHLDSARRLLEMEGRLKG